MTTVTVQASKTYDVQIGEGLLAQLGEQVRARSKASAVALISDDCVAPLYADAAEKSLQKSRFSVCRFVFPNGEASKNGQMYLHLLQFLAEHHLTRTDVLVALGGGVVGDLSGFAAATYLRGIHLIQVPTTLLAAVDSSVGGKTAIDLPAGKNLAGAFYQPELVLCDYTALRTLPQAVFLDGCAEVIKYAILGDPELFAHLRECGPDFDRERVIADCVRMKRDVVNGDEFDTGRRQLLNLGHTAAHGIEACSGYAIPHGHAVAAGLGIITRAASAKGYCSRDCCHAVEEILQKFQLPVSTTFSATELTERALSDKKRCGDTISLVIPREIGHCELLEVPVDELEAWMRAGLQ